MRYFAWCHVCGCVRSVLVQEQSIVGKCSTCTGVVLIMLPEGDTLREESNVWSVIENG